VGLVVGGLIELLQLPSAHFTAANCHERRR
jgi:hypothetical protein